MSESSVSILFGFCDNFTWRDRKFSAALFAPRKRVCSCGYRASAATILCEQGLPIEVQGGVIDVSQVPGATRRAFTAHYLSHVSWFVFICVYLPCAVTLGLILIQVPVCGPWDPIPTHHCHSMRPSIYAGSGAAAATLMLIAFKAFQQLFLMRPAAHIRALYLAQLGLDIDDERGDLEARDSSAATAGEAQHLSASSPVDDIEQPLLRADSTAPAPEPEQ